MNDSDQEFSVDLTKKSHSLGFTISTYIGDLNSGSVGRFNPLVSHLVRISHTLNVVRKPPLVCSIEWCRGCSGRVVQVGLFRLRLFLCERESEVT